MDNSLNWQPNASLPNLRKRSAIINQIRRFFNIRDVLEVETPSMSKATVTDIYLFPFQTNFITPGNNKHTKIYLITSPEYHMKRLLAAGSGPIFQICHSFRNKEIGDFHNPEFTMLEWYRPYYDMHCLMNEVSDLLQQVLNLKKIDFFSYKEIFTKYVGINPLLTNRKQLFNKIKELKLNEAVLINDDSDNIIQLLFTLTVKPNIGYQNPVFIYHFPASQAQMAAINTEDPKISDRFEVYFKGVELANGFRELTNANEQYQRFEKDNYKRTIRKITEKRLIDKNFLSALTQGMPECSGVALGIDRLVMLALNANKLSDVIAFTLNRA